MKCQLLNANHLAAKCMHPNTCRTCSKEHRTADCEVVDQAHFWCTSCKAVGHMSWDWLCPAFIEVSSQLERTDPEHTYRFFPTHKPWTWEQTSGNSHAGIGGWKNASNVQPQMDGEWVVDKVQLPPNTGCPSQMRPHEGHSNYGTAQD